MLLVHGKVFMGDCFDETLQVRVENSVISEIGNLAPRRGEPVTDLNGDYLLPGFVDVHIHASQGVDTMQGEEAVRAMSRFLYTQGVAAFCPTTMSANEADTHAALQGIRAVMAQPEKEGAHVLGAHMEAPFLQEKKAGAQLKEFFADPDWAYMERVTDGESGLVRLITLAAERNGAEAFIRQAVKNGIRVSVGHTDADAETVHQAGDWGADHVTHTFNAQTPIHHRKPGVPGAVLTDDRFYCEAICDGVHLHRDIVRLIARCKGNHAVAITDAMEAAGLPDGEYGLGGQKVLVHGAEARLEDGTLAGSVLTMPKALENLIHRFDIDPIQACAMCTRNPANSIGETKAGRIAPGAPAPLTRWSGDWKMVEVIV